mgnify:CR=1 FL=1
MKLNKIRQFDESEYTLITNLMTSSLKWINTNLHRFSPVRSKDLNTWDVKSFSELSFLYARLIKCDHPLLKDTLPQWRKFLRYHIENPIFAQAARKRPITSFPFLFPYLMLRSQGYRNEYYEETLRIIDKWGYFESIEVVPYRAFDLVYTYWKAGLREEPNWESLYMKTVLGRSNNSFCIDEDSAYSITHTIFYLTDVGSRPFPISKAYKEHSIKMVESLLLHFWRIGHWDLMGELLINLNSIGFENKLLFTEAKNAFHEVWRDNGAVPGMKIYPNFPNTSDTEEEFQSCYHTTLVGIFYCATSLNHIDNIGGRQGCLA